MTDKLDLFGTLGKISKKHVGLYQELSADERKQLHPLVVMRWLTGDNDPTKIILLNEFVNPHVFPLAKHPQLLVDLMTVCMDGHPARYRWIKAEKKKVKFPIIFEVIKTYYNYSTREAKMALPALTNDAILQHAMDIGTQPDDIKKLKKEMKERVKIQL